MDTIFDFIKIAPCQSMTYDLIGYNNPELEFTLIVKEESEYLKKISKYKPIIELRSGIFEQDNVLLTPIMLRADINNDMIYESWFNYHQGENRGAECLASLTEQNTIKIMFFNEMNQLIRTIAINNQLVVSFCEFRRILNRYNNQWSMEEFDNARLELYKSFNTVKSLWEKLK